MKQKQQQYLRYALVVCLLVVLGKGITWYAGYRSEQHIIEHKEALINAVLAERLGSENEFSADPFGDDMIVRVLLLGMDYRVGSAHGH